MTTPEPNEQALPDPPVERCGGSGEVNVTLYGDEYPEQGFGTLGPCPGCPDCSPEPERCPHGCVNGVITDSDLGGEGTSSYCPIHGHDRKIESKDHSPRTPSSGGDRERSSGTEPLVLYRCEQGHWSEGCAYGLDDTEAEGLPLCVVCPPEEAWEVTRVELVDELDAAGRLNRAEARASSAETTTSQLRQALEELADEWEKRARDLNHRADHGTNVDFEMQAQADVLDKAADELRRTILKEQG